MLSRGRRGGESPRLHVCGGSGSFARNPRLTAFASRCSSPRALCTIVWLHHDSVRRPLVPFQRRTNETQQPLPGERPV